MPLKLLLDENLRDRQLWSALERHNRENDEKIDVVRVGDENGPDYGTPDLELIAWAAAEDRILIGLDKNTLPKHLNEFCSKSNSSPGIVFLRSNLSAIEIVELLHLLSYVTEEEEWANTYRWIP